MFSYFLAVCILLLSTDSTIEATVNKETLFATKKVIAAKIDPAGKKIAYIGAKEGRFMNLFVTNDATLDGAAQYTHFTDANIIQFFWSPDGNKVIIVKDHLGKGRHHIFGIDIETKSITDYTEAYTKAHARLYHISPSENRAIIGLNERDPNFHDLYVLDFDTKKLSLLYENHTYQKFLFSDSLQIVLKCKVASDGEWNVYSADDRMLLQLNAEDAFHSSFLRYNEKEKRIYFLDNRDTDTTQLKSISIENPKNEVLIADPKISDVDTVTFVHNTPIAYASYHVFKKWHVLDPLFQEDFSAIEKKLGMHFQIMSRDAHNDLWLLYTDYPDIGPEFWLYNRHDKSLEHLFTEYPEGDFSKVYPLVVEARDGLELVCYYTLPKSSDSNGKVSKPIPLVVFPHGGPFKVRDCYSFDPYCQWLSSCGYATLRVNFRLSSGFGKAFVNAGNGHWGKKAHHDVLDAVLACVHEKITTQDSVAIFGGSYGGYEALAACAFSPDFFKCAIAFCGPSNLQTVLSKVPSYWEWTLSPLSDEFGFFTKQAFITSMGGDPDTEEGKAYLESCSPLNFIDRMKTPLLLAHGIHDHIVAESESRSIFEKLALSGRDVEYLLFTDEGHRIYEYRNKMALFDKAEKFLAKYLHGSYVPVETAVIAESSMQEFLPQ